MQRTQRTQRKSERIYLNVNSIIRLTDGMKFCYLFEVLLSFAAFAPFTIQSFDPFFYGSRNYTLVLFEAQDLAGFALDDLAVFYDGPAADDDVRNAG